MKLDELRYPCLTFTFQKTP